MEPSDLGRFAEAGDPHLSPDGRHVAYVVRTIDLEANEYRSRVWVAGTDDSTAPRPLTAGEHSDAQPRWSPDGSSLAFTSTRRLDEKGKKKSTLHLLPFELPGETILLAESSESIGSPTFSPDGTHLVVTMRTPSDEYKEDDARRRAPRVIDQLNFSLNGEGFILDRPQHLYVVAIDGSTGMRNLTDRRADISSPSWFPDSRRLAVDVNPFRDRFSSDIAVVDLDGNFSALTDDTGVYFAPSVSPDGSTIAVLGHDDPSTLYQNAHVGLLDPESSGTPQWITTDLDRTWAPFINHQAPTWTASNRLVASIEDRGNIGLRWVDTDGSHDDLIGGDRYVNEWTAGSVGGEPAIAYASTDPSSPAEIHLNVGGVDRKLTSVTSGFIAATDPRPVEHFLAPSDDVEVDAWILTPPDFDPSQTYPMLLNIHGGPYTQYGNAFMDEFQLQARAGYVVVYSNPRGGSGRTDDWAAAIRGPKHHRPGAGWGSVDYDDLMAVVDTALERYPFIDSQRLGVLGGSYGGYMTSWIITHNNRFKAACSERAANNLLTLEHGSDIAGFFSAELGPVHALDPEEYARMSPSSYVENIETPLLIIHSEDDLRCPVEQATQLFVACRLLGKEVEYVLFPNETHELSRSGSPVHRQQRAEIILEFFDKHLKL
ncbi:MAG: prolyl oligopeptidase family serine peptidase [Acidimicrobiales bacterium]